MPACRQCGKQNPEGTVFCGYCAASLAAQAKPAVQSGSPKPSVTAQPKVLEPAPSSPKHEVKPPPAKMLKPEARQGAYSPPPPPADSKAKAIEWLPWSELSGGQRAGRAAAGVVGLLLIFFFLRGILRGMGSSTSSASAPQSSEVAMSEGDRKDGIESLCKVFQIYGIPKNEQDAGGAAKNAAELFKLAGNQSPERSMFILTTIAGQFRDGTLKAVDCAEAGAPIGTTANSDAPAPNSGPTR